MSRAAAVMAACLAFAPPSSAAEGASNASGASARPARAAAGDSPRAAAAFGAWGFELSGMDRTMRPGDDFFAFASGGWEAGTAIPSDKPSYGMLDALADRVRRQVQQVVQSSETPAAPAGGEGRKIGALYHAFMDEARLVSLDAGPIRPHLARLEAISTKAEMARLMGETQQGWGASFFRLAVSLDDKEPTRYALAARQSGLSLPGRDYYLEPSFAAKKQAFRAYVANMLATAAWPDPAGRADDIVRLETRIAEASWPIAESQQLEKTYHPLDLAQLQALAPGFHWRAWLDGAGVAEGGRIIVRQDTAFPKIAKIFSETDLGTLKAWEAFTIVDQAAPYLSRRFADAHFQFHRKELLGQNEDRPRWQRGVDFVSDTLGDLVGREYVARYFPASSKARMEALVAELKQAFRRRIEKLTWMTAPTKRRALEKLAALRLEVGYPRHWRDYGGLRVDPDDLAGDAERAAAFEWAYERGKLARRVDREEWETSPQTVNAFYDEKRNEVVFPAAILQPPFFDRNADMAVNFGSIGGVIGHEMTHGFDSQGRKTDAAGRLADWWQPEDAARFNAEAAKLAAQYGAFSVAPERHVDGNRTMSENIADLGGVLLAIDAYRAWLGGRRAPMLDGFTGDQRVFLGWAQILRAKIRPDALVRQVTVDPHSPDRFRVVGPVRNIDDWYRAWAIGPSDRLYLPPKDRVRIW